MSMTDDERTILVKLELKKAHETTGLNLPEI